MIRMVTKMTWYKKVHLQKLWDWRRKLRMWRRKWHKGGEYDIVENDAFVTDLICSFSYVTPPEWKRLNEKMHSGDKQEAILILWQNLFSFTLSCPTCLHPHFQLSLSPTQCHYNHSRSTTLSMQLSLTHTTCANKQTNKQTNTQTNK